VRKDWPRIVFAHSRAKPGAVGLLAAMAAHANEFGYCKLSVHQLSAMTKRSDRQVQRHLRELCELGELRLAIKGNGRGNPSKYCILINQNGA
jgi:Helix-turn-helix domain